MNTAQAKRPMRSMKSNLSTTGIGYAVYIIFQFAVLAALTRLTDPETVGRWALAHAICNTLHALTNGGLRQNKATDISGQHKFADLLTIRVISSVLTIPIAALVAIMLGADRTTIIVTIVMASGKIVDCLVDVTYGLFQVNDRLSWLSRSLIYRSLVSFSLFLGVLVSTQSLVLALVAQGVGWLLVMVLFEMPKAASLEPLRPESRRTLDQWQQLFRLYLGSMSIALGGFCVALQTNAPRFAIYHIAGLKVFGYLTVILYFYNAGLYVANSIGAGSMARMALHFHDGKTKAYLLLYGKLMILLGIIGPCGAVAAWLLGSHVLRWGFGAEYAFLWPALIVLGVALTLRYVGMISSDALLAQRKFWTVLAINAVIAVLALIAAYVLTARFELYGAVWSMAIVSGIHFVAMAGFVLYGVRHIPKQADDQGQDP